MSTPTQTTDNGIPDAKTTPVSVDIGSLSEVAKALAMAVALQRTEWAELRSTPGIVIEYSNLREPSSGRSILIVAFGLLDGDVIGDYATGKITVNGIDVDEVVAQMAESGNKEEGKDAISVPD